MKMQLKPSLAYLAALCGTLGMAWGAHADWFYDFQTAPPPSFVTSSNPPSGTFSASAEDGVLHFSDTTPFTSGGPFVADGVETSQVFTDVRLTGTLNPAGTTNNLLLLAARQDSFGSYVAGIAFGDIPGLGVTAGTLSITKNVFPNVVEVVQSSDDSQGNQPALQNLATSYFLQWDLVGDQQTARVFDHEGGTQLLVVHYTDAGVGGLAQTSGVAGMVAIATVDTVDGTFGSVGAAALTEWSYDFQTAPPPSFLIGNVSGSPTFSSSVAGGVLRLFDTSPPPQGGTPIAFALETSVVLMMCGSAGLLIQPERRTTSST